MQTTTGAQLKNTRQARRQVPSNSFCGMSNRGMLAWMCIVTATLLQQTAHLAHVAAQESEQRAGEQHDDAHKYTNALIDSTSPYLLQHAHNPVNWMPWSPEAFAKAKAENKPVFVSVGYSTCYWCHVMERESFEDEGVAEILNTRYVAIKVDREQRPDIDEQLMLATQLMTGRGGWPNSVWLTVDGRPWMAGTYFPREQFKSALTQLADIWEQQAANVDRQADSLTNAIRSAAELDSNAGTTQPSRRPWELMLAELEQTYDSEHGGFGGKPKFPPHGVLRVLSVAASQGDRRALAMLTKTLDAMWCGGVHDHVGGGFHRYSTDARWFLPHFEKMLYDNAQLMRAYTEAFAVTKHERYRTAVADIFLWIQAEMTDSGGAFYSALDSESEEGEEGRYYTWSQAELNSALGTNDAQLFSQAYNFQPDGNFAEEATGKKPGTNIPFRKLASAGSPQVQAMAKLRAKLRQVRRQREYPHLDDKILTAWNGLMISALARAGAVFENSDYTRAAEGAAHFLLTELVTDQGKLLRSWREGKASLPGYLNDYAFLAEGLLELHLATDDPKWLRQAEQLAGQMNELFWDPQQGGWYFTSADHEELLLRTKNLSGGGNLPNGNGVAAQVLIQLFELTQKPDYLRSVEETLHSFGALMQRAPRSVDHLVLANQMYFEQAQKTDSSPQVSEENTPDATYSDSVIRAELYTSETQVKPGAQFAIAVRIQIAKGYHLYGQSEEEQLVLPTKLQIPQNRTFALANIRAPQGKIESSEVLDTKLMTFEDTIWFYATVNVEATGSMQSTLMNLELVYQACDDRLCLRPKTCALQVPIDVQPNAASQPRHTEIFQAASSESSDR